MASQGPDNVETCWVPCQDPQTGWLDSCLPFSHSLSHSKADGGNGQSAGEESCHELTVDGGCGTLSPPPPPKPRPCRVPGASPPLSQATHPRCPLGHALLLPWPLPPQPHLCLGGLRCWSEVRRRAGDTIRGPECLELGGPAPHWAGTEAS